MKNKIPQNPGIVAASAPPISTSNIGNKMLRNMGWNGGGLGIKEDGMEVPIEIFIRKKRAGLGTI